MKKAEKKAAKSVQKKAAKKGVKKEQKKNEAKKVAVKVPVKAPVAPVVAPKIIPVKPAPAGQPIVSAAAIPESPMEKVVEGNAVAALFGSINEAPIGQAPFNMKGVEQLVNNFESLEQILMNAQDQLISIAMEMLKGATDGKLDLTSMLAPEGIADNHE